MRFSKLIPFIFISLFFVFYSHGFQNKIKYKGIDRTLQLLQSSTKENPQSLEILFYGQSIIGGIKPQILIDSLQKNYPYTSITYKHKPIGGFTVPDLIKTAEHDVYHENPDLIIFHAYEGIEDGLLDELIKRIRSKMPSDILLLDHHYVWNTNVNNLKTINTAHDLDSESIKSIAKKYDCGFVKVRKEWKHYLDTNNLTPNKLIGNTVKSDVHPNAKGNALLRQIIYSKLTEKPQTVYSRFKDSLRDVVDIEKHEKQLNLNFYGNRLELIMQPQEEKRPIVIEVLIDNKKPSLNKNSYYLTRSTKTYGSKIAPAIKEVSFGETFPREEDWTLTITELDRINNNFKFQLVGSKTGFDGYGSSTKNFVSNSNRIVINKDNFHIFETEKLFNIETPKNFEISFTVKTLVKDVIVIPHYKSRQVLFNDIKAGNHQLDLKIIKGDRKILKITAFSPYLQNNE
nr:SGNH/GDSL hydrolase family protein [uncultured Psychroserpens sp.]